MSMSLFSCDTEARVLYAVPRQPTVQRTRIFCGGTVATLWLRGGYRFLRPWSYVWWSPSQPIGIRNPLARR